MDLGPGTQLPWLSGQAVLPTLLRLGVPEGLWWGDESPVQIKGSVPGARRCLGGLTALAHLLFLRPWAKPVRYPWGVAVSLCGAFSEDLVSADVDISGEAAGARPEAQALRLGQMRQAEWSHSFWLCSLLNGLFRTSCEGRENRQRRVRGENPAARGKENTSQTLISN